MNIEKILFFDIETVRSQRELDIESTSFSAFQYKMRDKITGELPDNDETIRLYNTSAALYPAFNDVVCISMAFMKSGKCYYKSITGTRLEILLEFRGVLESGMFETLCGFNIKLFDVPVLRMKFMQEGIPFPAKFSDAGKKPWELSFIDLMEQVKGTYYQSISLNEVCEMLGIPTPKDDISGHQVSDVYWNEEDGIERIATYCDKDVITNVKLYCRIFNIPEPTEYISRNLSLMDQITEDKKISDANKTKLLAYTKSMTKKEREAVITILRAATSDSSDYTEFYNEIIKQKKTK